MSQHLTTILDAPDIQSTVYVTFLGKSGRGGKQMNVLYPNLFTATCFVYGRRLLKSARQRAL